ncbi:class I SAM-dependent methyltransferase [Kitasatospora griseola]|uniref:class I SAM-dependent methyltransferase n=1 Tax=Kitasatospora griseola TaxID=2064 RepID=UPI001671645E|nr:class I SAM-dependent methyltransferase [Kitasatospora griseola]
MTYDPIAEEYYGERHVTSRNFDAATTASLKPLHFEIAASGPILEIGAGRGRVQEYLGVAGNRVIQVDISLGMLSLQPREMSAGRIVAAAENLPFADSSFSLAVAFLYDPFNYSRAYREIARVLGPSGLFIGTLPSQAWGLPLRRSLDLPETETEFVLHDGSRVRRPSRLTSHRAIRALAEKAGLIAELIEDFPMPRDVSNISPHVKLPAQILGISPFDLPLITVVIARKGA